MGWNQGGRRDVESRMTPVSTPITRRSLFAGTAAATLGVLLAACGDDTAEPVATEPGDTLPPVDTPGAIDHPSGTDEVILEYGEYGGFLPASYAFVQQPSVLISGDGRVFVPGAVPAIFPGPLLPAVGVRSISEDGIQRVLAAARDAGLFTSVEYSQPADPIADAATATVRINADGGAYVHEAYALGYGTEADAARAVLAAFIERLRDLPALAGAENLGDETTFVPEEYAIRATPLPGGLPADSDDGVAPRLVDWPADAGLTLADAGGCATVESAAVGELFAAADQLTYFDDSGVVYEVFVRPVWPGGDC